MVRTIGIYCYSWGFCIVMAGVSMYDFTGMVEVFIVLAGPSYSLLGVLDSLILGSRFNGDRVREKKKNDKPP